MPLSGHNPIHEANRSAAELREVWADLAEQRLRDAGADSGDFGKIDAPDPRQLGPENPIRGLLFLRSLRFTCWRRWRGGWLELLQVLPDLSVASVNHLPVAAVGLQRLLQRE
jgi:hypothetical protein